VPSGLPTQKDHASLHWLGFLLLAGPAEAISFRIIHKAGMDRFEIGFTLLCSISQIQT